MTTISPYLVYVCGKTGYTDGVPIDHDSAENAARAIAGEITGVEKVTYLGTVKGCSKRDIHVYEDEQHWIYNVVDMGEELA